VTREKKQQKELKGCSLCRKGGIDNGNTGAFRKLRNGVYHKGCSKMWCEALSPFMHNLKGAHHKNCRAKIIKGVWGKSSFGSGAKLNRLFSRK
jgi:hypothetical protein